MTKTPYNFVSDERFQLLGSWIGEQGYRFDTLTPMSADAGFRRYFRLQIDSETLIAVDAPPEYEDTARFVEIANTLHKSGLITPVVHCYNLENGFMLLSDLGSLHLQDCASPNDTESAQPLYYEALLNLVKMQRNAPTDGLPVYTADFLRQELELFPQWYVRKHHQFKYNATTEKQLERCFDLCIDSALEQPSVFVHRDYHCRNLMIQPDRRIAIIDFQGALVGPVTYDLVSLLRDAYVEWPDPFIDSFLEMHYHSLPTTKPINAETGKHTAADTCMRTYRRWFDLMGLQRHLKILGIFCRLHHRDRKSHYLDSIPLVRKHVESVCLNYPEFSVLHDLLAQLSQPPNK